MIWWEIGIIAGCAVGSVVFQVWYDRTRRYRRR